MKWSKIKHLIYLNIKLSLDFSGAGALTRKGVTRECVFGWAHHYPLDSQSAGISTLKMVNT